MALTFVASGGMAVLANSLAAAGLTEERQRPALGHAVAVATICSFQALCLALTARSLWSLWAAATLCAALWFANRLKRSVLREPLLFSDLDLLGQVFRHPHLYLAYAPGTAAAVALVWLFLGAAIFVLEAGGLSLPTRSLLAATAILPCAAFLLLLRGWDRGVGRALLRAHRLEFSPLRDAGRFTPMGSAFLHSVHHASRLRLGVDDLFDHAELSPTGCPCVGCSGPRPDLLLVQAESFCDVRRHLSGPDLPSLDSIDRAMSEGRSGRLLLDWSGAYTMRTEFAVLTGLDIRGLETFGFNPYAIASRRRVSSLATRLRALGYRCVCLHPYDPDFFRRRDVMRNFGFEEFLGIEHLEGAERNGPYVSDSWLLGHALRLLKASPDPTFIFVVTMEAHGPWLPGRFDGSSVPGQGAPGAVGHYFRHLSSLDEGVGKVLDAQCSDRGLVFGLYGDHVPSLPIISGAGPDAAASDYLVWAHDGIHSGREREDLRPESLQRILLDRMGICC